MHADALGLACLLTELQVWLTMMHARDGQVIVNKAISTTWY